MNMELLDLGWLHAPDAPGPVQLALAAKQVSHERPSAQPDGKQGHAPSRGRARRVREGWLKP